MLSKVTEKHKLWSNESMCTVMEAVKMGVRINRVAVELGILRMISRTGYQALCKGQNQGQN